MPDPANWEAVLAEAKGQTVYFHAWGGEPRINDYIAWAAQTVLERFGVRVVHVKVSDTAEVGVARADREGRRPHDGRRRRSRLDQRREFRRDEAGGASAAGRLVDRAAELPLRRRREQADGRRATSPFRSTGWRRPGAWRSSFSSATPRGSPEPPTSAAALGAWIAKNPGRFTYPQPPDFTGTTFLKQLLVELAPDRACSPSRRPTRISPRPRRRSSPGSMRRSQISGGAGAPSRSDYGGLRRLLADSEVDIAFAFNPSDASERHRQGRAAGHGAQLRFRGRHARQHALSWRFPSMPTPPPAPWCSRIS